MKMKKFAAMILSLAVCAGAACGFTGCTKPDDGKTQLRVAVFNGGLGVEWAYKLEKAFEEKYKDVSFESGKMGVNVTVFASKDLLLGNNVDQRIANNSDDIYYLVDVGQEHAFRNNCLDITDIVKEKVYMDNGELADMTYDPVSKSYVLAAGAEAPTKSLYDKMTAFHRENFDWKVVKDKQAHTEQAAQYFALPYENSVQGFIYDHGKFAQNGLLHPNEPGYDADGMPATEDAFFDLLEDIKQKGWIPFAYKQGDYWYGVSAAYFGQYEGEDKAMISYTMQGEVTFKESDFSLADETCFTRYDTPLIGGSNGWQNAEGMTDNGNGTYTAAITEKNAWLLAYRSVVAKYVDFMDRLITKDNIDVDRAKETYDYHMAQRVFIKGQQKTGKNIAFIVEGEWWENEARNNWSASEYGKNDYRFYLMPHIDGQQTGDIRSLGTANEGTEIIVGKNTPVPELCRLWLQFAHSESALEEFTLTSGVLRDSFDYDLSEAQQAQLTKFGKHVYALKKQAADPASNVRIFRPATARRSGYSKVRPMGGYGAGIGNSLFGAIDNWNSTRMMSEMLFDRRAAAMPQNDTYEELMQGVFRHYNRSEWEQGVHAYLSGL